MKGRERMKRWWMLGAGVMLLLVVLYVYGRQLYSESRSVLVFIDALQTEDAASLSASLITDKGNHAVDEETARKLLDYLAENNRIDEAIADLQMGYEGYMPDSRILAVVKKGKHFGLYDRYRIAVATSEVRVSTNLEGTVITLGGQTVATADSDDYHAELGPFIPGTYELEAIYEGEYAHLRTEQKVEIAGADGMVTADLLFNAGMLQVEANYENAAIYIDGMDTGAVTGGGDPLGPVALDGSNKVHAELAFPWGVAKSAPIPVGGETVQIRIDPNTDELKEAVMQAVSTCILTWTEAYNKLDPAVVMNLSEERRAELTASVEEYKAQGMKSETQEKKLIFDTDSIYVQQDEEGAYRAAASFQRTYATRYYTAEETPPPFETYTDTMTYRLSFMDGEWVVGDWYEEYHFNSAHTKEWVY